MAGFVLLALSLQKNPGLSHFGFSLSAPSGDFGTAGLAVEGSGESSMRSTKTNRIRPSAEELARKRAEGRPIELVRELQKMRDGGLSDQHPAIKIIAEELAKNPDIRTELKSNGIYTLWTRKTTESGSQLNQYQFSEGGDVALKTVYRVNQNGSPLSSKIFDEKSNELFKISYGYRKSDGMLVEERIFDSRSRPMDNRGVGPIRRILHGVNADDGLPESNVIDSAPPSFPPQMEIGFRNPFFQQ